MKSPSTGKMKAPMKKLDEPMTTKREIGRKGKGGLVREGFKNKKRQMFRKYMQSKTGCTLNISTEKQTNHCALPPATLVELCFQKKRKKKSVATGTCLSTVSSDMLTISNYPKRTKTFSSPHSKHFCYEKKAASRSGKAILRWRAVELASRTYWYLTLLVPARTSLGLKHSSE